MSALLWLLALVLYVLHQDVWLWRVARPLVFGIFPIGLAYHVAYTLATSAFMALLVRQAWPSHLERLIASTPKGPRE